MSEQVLILNKSSHYCRLIILLYAFTGYFLIMSSLFLLVKAGLLFILARQLLEALQSKKPHPLMGEIHYKQKKWRVYGAKIMEFETVRLLVDAGIFQLLLFSNENKDKKMVVLFKDQLDSNQFRSLQLFL